MADRIAWENNVLGFITPTDWLDVNFQITRPNDPADMLFGDQKTANLVMFRTAPLKNRLPI